MKFMEWTTEYAVGVETLDAQHKKLFAMLNDLHEAMREGEGSALVGQTLADLIAYTNEHFSAEEALMQQAGYTLFLNHKAEHEKLTARVMELFDKYEKGNAMLSVSIMNFIAEWLSAHTMASDKKYAPFLIEAGIK